MTALTQSIHELTRPHLPKGARLGDPLKPALLDQLREAAKPDRSGGASGGSDAPKIPIDAGAISLEQDITRAARDEHYELFGHDIGTVAALIQAFATTEGLTADYLARVTAEWCDQITGYLNPTKPPYRPAVPCPACGVLYDADGNGPGLRVHCWGIDEELLPNGEWSATCIHCDAGWTPGKQMDFLRGYMTKVAA